MSGWGEELKELTAELTHTLGKIHILLLMDTLSGSEWSVAYSWLLTTRSQQNNIIKMKNKRIKKKQKKTKKQHWLQCQHSLCGCQKLLVSLTYFAKMSSIHAEMIA